MSTDENDIVLLEMEHLLDINDIIRQKSKVQREIDYSGEETYPIEIKKLQALKDNAPSGDILEIAAYYLKNIILLQPFPDGNHRTALASVEFFLRKNGYDLTYTAEEALEFQKDAFNVRLKTYGNYDQHNISILTKLEDSFFEFCENFIESRLTKRN